MKQADTADLLRRIYDEAQISRTELAAQTGFAPSHIGAMVRDLMKRGSLQESGFAPSKGGRRRVLLQINPDLAHFLGVDIGTANCRVVVADFLGKILSAETFPTEVADDKDYVLDRVHVEIARLLRQDRRIKGIGVAASGVIDRNSGTVLFWPKVKGWRNVPLKEIIERKHSLPVVVEDSTRTMAIAEQRFGQAKGLKDFVFVSVGMGVGAAIFVDGRLYTGTRGLAGELGHTTIDETGELCSCGNKGCLEVFASGWAIIRKVRMGLDQGVSSSIRDLLQDPNRLSVEVIAAAAERGDRLAERTLSEAGMHLGTALANIVNLLNPQKVIFGGAVAEHAQQLLLEPVTRAMKARAFQHSLAGLEVAVSSLGNAAAARGATAIAGRHFLEAGPTPTRAPRRVSAVRRGSS